MCVCVCVCVCTHIPLSGKLWYRQVIIINNLRFPSLNKNYLSFKLTILTGSI
jgi:hypothetical protein